MQAKVVRFQLTTAAPGTKIPLNGIGFAPDLMIFLSAGKSDLADGVVTNTTPRPFFGVAASPTSQWCVANRHASGAGSPPRGSRGSRSDACLAIAASESAWDGAWELDSFEPDGCVFEVLDAFTATWTVTVIALQGIRHFATGNFAEPGSAGNQDVVLPFKPTGLILASVLLSTDGGVDFPGGISIGLADSYGKQYTLAHGYGTTSGAPDTHRWRTTVATDSCVNLYQAGTGGAGAPGINGKASLVQLQDSGFRMNWSLVTAGARLVFYLAFDGVDLRLGDFEARTTLVQFSETDQNSRPAAILFLSGAAGGGAKGYLGAAGPASSRFAASWWTRGDDSIGDAGHGQEGDEVLQILDGGPAASIDGLVDMVSFDGQGFTCQMDDAAAAVRFCFYGQFGAGPAPAQIDLISWIDA